MQNLLDTFSPVSSEEWMKQIEKELKGKSPEIINWKISDNLILKPFYLADEVSVSKAKEKVSLSQQREICEYIKVLQPETANKQALKALMQGANALHFNCINADISSDYFEQLLNEIQWQYIHIHFTINQGEDFVKALNEWCIKNKINTSNLKGSICFDIYHRELVKGIAADEKDFELFISCVNKFFPALSNICVNATSYLNAGADVIQELAYTCAHLNEYLNLFNNTNLLKKINSIQIQIAVGSNYLVEIAKLRVLRMLLASIMDKYDLKNELFIYAFTAKINKSHKDAYNNMLRATTEVMSAIIGGANQISVLPYDEISGETSDFSQRIARNISLILSEESYLDKVIDPAAGSYLIEKLTNDLAERAWEKFCEIENKGGWKSLLHNGEMIKDIESNAEKVIEEYRKNKKVLIGVNKYPNKNDKELSIDTKDTEATSEPNTLTELIVSSML
ncbi:MAG: methylmalonyl-CoA mutase [Bacteroidia bacterium]|nr:MAG: methylmalonyl-CoA mutase [Bacteroidia bacterium]